VGRAAELEQLAARLADARAGRGGFVLLRGPPGIGKSRTVEVALARAGMPPERVLWGRCTEQPGAPPFWPWVRILRAHLEPLPPPALREVVGPAAEVVAELLPELRAGLATLGPRAASADPIEGRFSRLDGLASVLLRAGSREALVAVLEDLHWADPSSLELLGFLAPDLPRSRLLVLATLRETVRGSDAPALVRLARNAEVLGLRGLSLAETALLVEELAGTAVAESVVASLQRSTGGNPFFLCETVRALAALERAPSDGEGAPLPLPESVRDAIRDHLAPLAPEARELLTLAAVVGHEFELGALAAAADLDAARALEQLGPTLALGLLEPLAGSVLRFRFAHALIPEALYADLAPLARAAHHRRVGLSLERSQTELRAPPLAALAHHFFRAAPLGEGERAVTYAERAGEEAARADGHAEAAAHFRGALDALAFANPEERVRLRLLLALGRAEANAGAVEPAREAFERASRIAAALGDAESLAAGALGYGRVISDVGAVNPTTVALLEQAEGALSERDSALRVEVLAQLANALRFSPEASRREALSRAALEMAQRLGDATALATASLHRHFELWGPDVDPCELLALADEALALGERIPERRLLVQIQRWRVVDLLELGETSDAEAEIERLARRCEQWRLPSYALHARLVRGALQLATGQLPAAAEPLARAYDGRFGGPLSNLGQTLEIHRFLLRLHRGELGESEPALRAAARLPVGAWRAVLALALVELGRADEARAELVSFAPASLPRDGTLIPALAVAAEAASRLDMPAAAAAIAAQLEPHATRYVVFGMGAGCYGSVERPLALAARTCGRRDEAVARLETATARDERAGLRTFLAYDHAELADALALRGGPGDRQRAAALRAQALREAEQLGLVRLLRRGPPRAAAAAGGRSAVDASLRRLGESFEVRFGERAFRLPASKGLAYLVELLRQPGRELHAAALAGGGPLEQAPGAGELAEARLTSAAGLGDAGELLDARARGAYRRRLADIREEQEDAERCHDSGRAERAREEREFLERELARALGLGGRARRAGSAAERARLNVTRALASAVRKLAAEDPDLGEHLAATIRTGLFCCYTPDPRRPVAWSLDEVSPRG
jgi:hypothetical protein